MSGNPNEAAALPADADLILAARSGDDAAYAQLYARHVGAARAAARSLIRSRADAEDLVSEAFTRVLRALRNGGGPELAFRPYLLTSVRNAFYDRTRKEARVEVTDEVPEDLDAVLVARAAMAGEDKELIAKAFANLPERWQTVLWHTEVEGRPPAEVAPMLGIAPNAVAALAYRAREGLREAYLQAHLQLTPPAACADTRGNLGGYVRDSLSNRDRSKVEQHLDGCDQCRAVMVELREISGSLRSVLPLVLLGVPASTYLGYLGAGGKGVLAFLAGRSRTQQVAIGGGVTATAVAVAVAVAAAMGGDPRAPQVAAVSIAATTTTATTAAPAPTAPTTRAATTTLASTTTTIAATTTVAPTTTVAATIAPTTTRAATTTVAAPTTTRPATTAPAPTTTTTVPLRAALNVSGSAIGPVVAGRTAFVSVAVSNNGPDAAPNARATVSLPAQLSYIGVQGEGWSCVNGAAVVCTRASLASGATSTLVLQTQVAAGATGSPTVVVSAGSDAVGSPTGASGNVGLGAVQSAGPAPLYVGIRRGDIATVGNTLRTCDTPCDPTAVGNGNNGQYAMVAVDVDGPNDTTASSRATLTLPSGAAVNRAWLVWGGTSSSATLTPADYRSVRLTGPGAVAVDYTGAPTGTAREVYGRIEVTEQVRASGAGVYEFASLGGYAEPVEANRSGGWALIVQYDRSADPLRTLVVLDGLVGVGTQGHTDEHVALGVLGPGVPAGGVNARVGLVAWDGDRGSADSVSLTSGATPTTVELADTANATTDVFNSTVAVGGLPAAGRGPAYENTLGFDADQFDVTVYGGGPLSLRLQSQSDVVQLGVITLSVPI